MDTLLLILIVVGILYFVFRKKPGQSPALSRQTRPAENDPPRDYLFEATDFVNAPSPLNRLLETNRAEVIQNLLSAMNLDADMPQKFGSTSIPMGPTIRKAAAYALGQIGDPRTVNALTSRLNMERASGVRDAIVASISAIYLAPDPEHSQLERRKIIGDVYNGRRPPQLSSWT